MEKVFFTSNYKFIKITILNAILYTINNFNPFEEKYFNKKSIANKDDRNVVKIPTIRGRKLNEENSSKE